jgi:hypothetical protein
VKYLFAYGRGDGLSSECGKLPGRERELRVAKVTMSQGQATPEKHSINPIRIGRWLELRNAGAEIYGNDCYRRD